MNQAHSRIWIILCKFDVLRPSIVIKILARYKFEKQKLSAIYLNKWLNFLVCCIFIWKLVVMLQKAHAIWLTIYAHTLLYFVKWNIANNNSIGYYVNICHSKKFGSAPCILCYNLFAVTLCNFSNLQRTEFPVRLAL